jgi:predicted enzyme related to lactoylglutathione lyase
MAEAVHGKICCIDIPATDVQASAAFYQKVFGWSIRQHPSGTLAFDDPTGAISGKWVLKRQPSGTPGILFYINVDSVAKAANAVLAAGGDIVQRIGVDAPDITARFTDPAGNVVGLFQEPKQS